MTAYARAWWCLEQVIFVASVAGELAAGNDVHRRQSGATLISTPPPFAPADTLPPDPLRVFEVVPEDTEDRDWWEKG